VRLVKLEVTENLLAEHISDMRVLITNARDDIRRAGNADQTINLTTTDTITETVTYTIKVQGNQFYQIFRNRPLADGVGTLDWESFIGVG
jgi:hypothetical protein